MQLLRNFQVSSPACLPRSELDTSAYQLSSLFKTSASLKVVMFHKEKVPLGLVGATPWEPFLGRDTLYVYFPPPLKCVPGAAVYGLVLLISHFGILPVLCPQVQYAIPSTSLLQVTLAPSRNRKTSAGESLPGNFHW